MSKVSKAARMEIQAIELQESINRKYMQIMSYQEEIDKLENFIENEDYTYSEYQKAITQLWDMVNELEPLRKEYAELAEEAEIVNNYYNN